MHFPLISVIVPVYNVEKYINVCVKSLLKQTYENIEIILIDDGSKDASSRLCDEWAMREKRIKVIHQENKGVAAARNAGLRAACGDYIGFVDSDDYVDENMYLELWRGIKLSGKKISCCYSKRVKNDNQLCSAYGGKESTYGLRETLDKFFIGKEISSAVWDKLFSKELFENIHFPEGETNEEYPMFIPLIIRANGMYHTGKELYCYRMNSDSITSTVWKTDAYIVLKHLSEMHNQIREYGLSQNYRTFCIFCAKSAFNTALHLDKNFYRINEIAKSNLYEYIAIMRKHAVRALLSENITTKNKILYLMIITRTLRPIYKCLGKLN